WATRSVRSLTSLAPAEATPASFDVGSSTRRWATWSRTTPRFRVRRTAPQARGVATSIRSSVLDDG
ncbi:MAG: hypothetical protein AVDCRST_MAG43-2285, partial [uncultured Thermomicrobiales bacterium]